ncbi:hypothetical protein FQN57_002309 [Myotisia sp. PD_48]|nr:hypothetical protein FQN57_002309 [Myotisia sp. PD_48]
MDTDRNEGTDQKSIRPVSSLLSHFENLSHLKHDRDGQDGSGSLLKVPQSSDASRLGRVSLDLHRPVSPWSSQTSLVEERPFFDRSAALRPQQTGDSPSPSRRRQSRPMSMSVQASSPRRPVLTVESPRSSPQEFLTNLRNRPPRAPLLNGDLNAGLDTPIRPVSRPLSPLSDSSGICSSNSWRKVDADRTPTKSTKSASVPPPVNRAEKPKIFGRNLGTPSTLEPRSNTLAPSSSQRTSFEDRISPFSTPPSSPEKSSPFPDRSEYSRQPPTFGLDAPRHAHNTNGLETREPQPTPKQILSTREQPYRTAPPPLPNKRSSVLFSKSSMLRGIADRFQGETHPENRMTLPHGPPSPPVRQSAKPRSAREPPTSHSHHLKPLSRTASTSSPKPAPPPPPRRESSMRSPNVNPVANKPKPPPSPMRPPPTFSSQSSLTRTTSSAGQAAGSPIPRIDKKFITNTDHRPDASHTNRRPPYFRAGIRGIPTEYGTRVFDTCGQYVCTTGFFTRVWDLGTGEMVMSLSHGESVKGSAIAFKPGRTMDEEGLLLWIGTTAGDILEVDIKTQAIIASYSPHSPREILRIYRHNKELWSLDDDGKLLLWPSDESGAPNLHQSHSNPYDRVAKGHTFSLVVGDILWYAMGKDIKLYRPNIGEANFQVLKSPLRQAHIGEITCGTVTTHNGGVVFFGHADGKVTIYRSSDYVFLGTVSISTYKISSLAIIGDYLWAGYKTGGIHVYDISTDPWTIKKEWKAHEHGVCGLMLDPSAIWTVNKLEVISLGVDNCIRLWDGMLEEDWLETKMQHRDVEYCQFRELTAAVLTWNAGATVPGSLHNSDFIRDAIHPESSPDILVFGFQELVDLENKKITAKSFLKGKRKDADAEHMSRQYRVWRDHLAACIRQYIPDQTYVLLHTSNLIGLFSCVFVKEEEKPRISNLAAAEIKRGMGGLHGNKGALLLRFCLDDSSLCFINCHLAAGQSHTAHRNNDISAIMETDSLPTEPSSSARIDRFVGGGDGSMILDHEICILNGDLNYRIDSIPRNTVIEAIKSNNLPKLLDRDQLLASKRKNPGFRLRIFNEAPITFAPTYKYDVGSDEYDSSEKKRAPAWCDRLLYRGVGRIKQLEYRRHEVRVSDHRPVSGIFKMRIKTISPEKRAAAWEASQKEFLYEKRRLATEASVDYLVRFLGIGSTEAYNLISST